MGYVHLEVDDGVGIVRIDRPPANAISHAVGIELGEAFGEAAGRDDIGAIVVSGGRKIFAAGADVKEMATFGPAEIRPVVSALADALDLLELMPKISIAAINGFALGGGLELALAADLRYLADDAKVGQPEILIGVIPGAGGTQRLTRLIGPGRTRELVYSGRHVPATEAVRLGIGEAIFSADDVFAAAVRDARTFAQGPRRALAAAKEAIRAASGWPLATGHARERDLFAGLFDTADQKEGMSAFLEKRDPTFSGGETS
jgi:enoyl-CoA hydratase